MASRTQVSRNIWRPARVRPLAPLVALVVLGAATLTLIGPSSAGADVTTVKGSAFGYFAKVSLFGGPSNLRGFGQQDCTAPNVPDGCVPTATPPSSSSSPSVALPASGGNLSQAKPEGAKAQYGPATIFGGKQCDTCTPPPSGPIKVDSQGTTGPAGSVTSSADITLRIPGTEADPGGVGPNTFVADRVFSTCTAATSGAITASAIIDKGILATSTDADGNALTTVNIPANPPANYTVTGTITNVGDNFKDVFNEQIMNSDGSLTVNAFHVYLLGPTAVGDLVVSSSTCGLSAVAAAVTTTTAASATTVRPSTTLSTATTVAGASSTTIAVATTLAQSGATSTTSPRAVAKTGSSLLPLMIGGLVLVALGSATLMFRRRSSP